MARSNEETPRTQRRTRRAEPLQAFPTHDAIARRAYELFLQEGANHGRDLAHWLKAEQELLNEVNRPMRRVSR